MKQYIPKSVVLAEIERLIKKNELYLNDNVSDEVRYQKTSAYSVLCDLRHFLNTIKVKEVDLEKEIEKYSMELAMKENNGDWLRDIITTAKYFFELGMTVSKEKEI